MHSHAPVLVRSCRNRLFLCIYVFSHFHIFVRFYDFAAFERNNTTLMIYLLFISFQCNHTNLSDSIGDLQLAARPIKRTHNYFDFLAFLHPKIRGISSHRSHTFIPTDDSNGIYTRFCSYLNLGQSNCVTKNAGNSDLTHN